MLGNPKPVDNNLIMWIIIIIISSTTHKSSEILKSILTYTYCNNSWILKKHFVLGKYITDKHLTIEYDKKKKSVVSLGK